MFAAREPAGAEPVDAQVKASFGLALEYVKLGEHRIDRIKSALQRLLPTENLFPLSHQGFALPTNERLGFFYD